MKIGQYCQRQRYKHVELELFLACFCDSWAFLLTWNVLVLREEKCLKVILTKCTERSKSNDTTSHLNGIEQHYF